MAARLLKASREPGVSTSKPSLMTGPIERRNCSTFLSRLAISPRGTGVAPSGNSKTRTIRPPLTKRELRLAPIARATARPESGLLSSRSNSASLPGLASKVKQTSMPPTSAPAVFDPGRAGVRKSKPYPEWAVPGAAAAMKVVFLQELHADAIAYFREKLPEHELVFPQTEDEEKLAQAARGADIAVGYRIPKKILEAAPN